MVCNIVGASGIIWNNQCNIGCINIWTSEIVHLAPWVTNSLIAVFIKLTSTGAGVLGVPPKTVVEIVEKIHKRCNLNILLFIIEKMLEEDWSAAKDPDSQSWV